MGNSLELRYKDHNDALNWLRGGLGDGIDDSSASIFEKIDGHLPNKEGQTEEARANEMENALNWLRGNGVNIEEEDFTLDSFDTLPQKTAPVNSLELRYKDRNDALNWLRGGLDDGIDDSSASIFEKIDGHLLNKEGQTEEARANEMENALNWLRGNGADATDDTFALDSLSLEKIGQQQSVVRPSEAREKDKDDALNWIRGAHTGIDDDSAIAEFKRIDAFLPKKEGQSEEDRAAEMADALDWIRSNDLDVKANESAVGS